MKRASRAVPLILAITLLSSSHLNAGGRPRAMAVSPPSSDLAITFLGSGGHLDAGTFAWRGGRRKSSLSSRTVRMRIGQPSRETGGTATVRAFLEAADPRCTVRINGVVMTGAPQVVQRHAPIGSTLSYLLEIEVPTTASDGLLQTAIGWEVTTE
jgi:hypothetical protein